MWSTKQNKWTNNWSSAHNKIKTITLNCFNSCFLLLVRTPNIISQKLTKSYSKSHRIIDVINLYSEPTILSVDRYLSQEILHVEKSTGKRFTGETYQMLEKKRCELRRRRLQGILFCPSTERLNTTEKLIQGRRRRRWIGNFSPETSFPFFLVWFST